VPPLEIGLCWGTLRQAGLLELIEAAGRHGFPTLSVRPDMILSVLADGMSETALRDRLRDAGVRIVTIDAITPAAGQPGALDVDQCLRAAEHVGASIVNANRYGGDPIAQTALIDWVADIARQAGRRGIGIALEFVPDTALPNLQTAHAVAQACGEANCSVLLDMWHHARSNGMVDDIRQLPPGALGSIQLDDRTPPAPGAPYVPASGRDLPGEGWLPLGDLMRAALDNSPGLSAELEVFSAELRALPIDAAAVRVSDAVRRWRSANGF
jgi:sugar phosphate isomerase/epimerase